MKNKYIYPPNFFDLSKDNKAIGLTNPTDWNITCNNEPINIKKVTEIEPGSYVLILSKTIIK